MRVGAALQLVDWLWSMLCCVLGYSRCLLQSFRRHDTVLPAAVCVCLSVARFPFKRKRLRFLRFSFTQRTQRKRLRLNGNRAYVCQTVLSYCMCLGQYIYVSDCSARRCCVAVWCYKPRDLAQWSRWLRCQSTCLLCDVVGSLHIRLN